MDLVIRLLQAIFGLVTAVGGATWVWSLEAGDPTGQIFGIVVGGVGLCFILVSWYVGKVRRYGVRI